MSGSDREEDAFQVFEDMFYEIEYDACPMPGVGKYVLKSRKIEPPQKDEVRERFDQMRNIARENRSYRFSNTKFYDRRVLQENSMIFYKQGLFMADFQDEYEKSVPYSSYYSDYQTMGYDQLRTYFTWRTELRKGYIENTSLSYAFLYIYELINNIGVSGPEEGLDRLVSFWDAFREYDRTVDKYVVKWLKDYHVYYELPHSFQDFVKEHGLEAFYQGTVDLKDNPLDRFQLYCHISKYNIRESSFFADHEEMVKNCFAAVMEKVEDIFAERQMVLEEYILRPTKSMSLWTPFQGALFYPHVRQRDRHVLLSDHEIYVCKDGSFSFSATISTESGRQLVGYCMKQLESVLRRLTKYPHKLSAKVKPGSLLEEEMGRAGISLEKTVTEAAEAFYREATRTVVKVDASSLARIREESLSTQEKLIVPEEEMGISLFPQAAADGKLLKSDLYMEQKVSKVDTLAEKSLLLTKEKASKTDVILEENLPSVKEKVSRLDASEIIEPAKEIEQLQVVERQQEADTPWRELWESFSEVERKALSHIIQGGQNLKKLADDSHVMLEVLLDGINEKAMDCVGDGILDSDFMIYDDYMEQVKEMMGGT